MKKKLLLTLLGATGIIAPAAIIAPAMVTEEVQFSKERSVEGEPGDGIYIADKQDDIPSYFKLSDNASTPATWTTYDVESIDEYGNPFYRIFIDDVVAGTEDGALSKFTISIFKKEGDLLVDEIILPSPLPLSQVTEAQWIAPEGGTEYYYTITTDAILKNEDLEGVKNNLEIPSIKPDFGTLNVTGLTHDSVGVTMNNFINGTMRLKVLSMKLSDELDANNESEPISRPGTGNHNFTISGLNPDTEYSFMLKVYYDRGNDFIDTGITVKFKTGILGLPIYGNLGEIETTYNSTKINLSSFTNGGDSEEVNGLKLVSGENSSNIIDNLSSGPYNFEVFNLNSETKYTFTLMQRSSLTNEWSNTDKIIDITTGIGGIEASYGELIFKGNKQFTLNNFVNGTLEKRLINIRLVATSSAREIIYSNIISDPQSGNIDFSIPNLVGGQSYTVAIEFQTESQTEWQNTNIGITEPINIPQESKKSGLSTGALIGIIIGSILAVTVIGLIIWYYKDPKFKSKVKKAFNKSDDEEQDNSDEEINNADKSSDDKADIEAKNEEINDDAKPKIADSLAKSLENINNDKNNNKINLDKEIPLNKNEFK